MQLTIQSIFKSLNKAYLKESVNRTDVELFKQQLKQLFGKADAGYSEDTLKDFVTEFLRNTWYNPNHIITINKERKDLSIHTGKTTKDPVGVIAEIKKTGSGEMITAEKPNVKAFHELVLYYLHERNNIGNNEIKYLLATDVNNWILIDANEFDKKIYRNTKIKRLYEVYVNDKKDNPFFYDELKKILDDTDDTFTCTQFNLDGYKKYVTNDDRADDKKLIPLYKILSPAHLLKLSFSNDSNSLDKNFYTELLHLVGLEEITDGSKKLIQRKKVASEASLIENAIIKLHDKDCLRDVPDVTKFGFTNDEQYENIALELCITWINRILFLKLLEAQLYSYHQKDKDYLFLNSDLIHDFDELNNLFLQVLAEKPANRRERLQQKFNKVPYLNSSLFERTELERKTIDISAIDNNLPLVLQERTVLKDENKKRRKGSLPTLNYIFTFLDSYDFASEGKVEIQEENKNLINASVLGLIFEKINGYKDGSFFTPGFITMYMCRETLRRAVVQKFNETNNWNCKSFEDLQELIEYADKEKRHEANNIMNSLTICDPAVGSGHFLVSALNELISIKHDLKILQYHHNGQRINHKEYKIDIENDELIIQDIETEDFFKYTLNQKGNIKPDLQYLQETLFHEKETLIENCLFGVDINANSVKICRLRLWIELLKNAYYTKESNYAELETLPNIDINIKQGNSLISRFTLDADVGDTLKKSKTWTIDSYKVAVQAYRNAQSKEEKRELEDLIETIKKDFKTTVRWNDPINKKLNKLRGELALLQRTDLFSADVKKKTKANKELEKLSVAINKLEKEKEATQSNAIYKEAFEWRFEFPEVLDDEGNFLGFDVVIGNPPYFGVSNLKNQNVLNQYKTFNKSADIYCLFYERGFQVLKASGYLSYITSNKWMTSAYGEDTRKFLSESVNPVLLVDFPTAKIFENATVFTNILIATNVSFNNSAYGCKIDDNFTVDLEFQSYVNENLIPLKICKEDSWKISDATTILINAKMEKIGTRLKEWEINFFRGITTGNNDAFHISNSIRDELIRENLNSKDLIKPLLRGRNIKRFKYTYEEISIIFTRQGIDIEKYPAIKNYLYNFYEELRPKNNNEITGRKPGNYSWFEIQDNTAYYEEFGKEKIIWLEISDKANFSYDENGMYLTNSAYFISGKNLKYLLAILNSKLSDFYFFQITAQIAGGRKRYTKQFVEQIPVPKVELSLQIPFEILVDKILTAKKEDSNADTVIWEREIDTLVYKLYNLTEEEIKLVEGKA